MVDISVHHFCVYDDTGLILRAGDCRAPAVEAQAMEPGENVLDFGAEAPGGIDHREVYVSEGALVPRPSPTLDKAEILADGSDTATVAGIPTGATVTVDGEAYTVADGVLEISTDVAGTYKIVISEVFPSQPFEANVVAS